MPSKSIERTNEPSHHRACLSADPHRSSVTRTIHQFNKWLFHRATYPSLLPCLVWRELSISIKFFTRFANIFGGNIFFYIANKEFHQHIHQADQTVNRIDEKTKTWWKDRKEIIFSDIVALARFEDWNYDSDRCLWILRLKFRFTVHPVGFEWITFGRMELEVVCYSLQVCVCQHGKYVDRNKRLGCTMTVRCQWFVSFFFSFLFCLFRRTILWAAGPRTKYPKGTRLVTGGASISWYIWTHRPLQNDTSSILIHQMLLWSGDGIFIFIPPPLSFVSILFRNFSTFTMIEKESKQYVVRSSNTTFEIFWFHPIWLFIFLWFYRLFSCLGRI